MLESFKKLNLGLKIIVGIIAFLLLPITLLLFSVELLIRSIKNKKIPGIIISSILCLLFLSASGGYLSGIFDSDSTSSLEDKISSLESHITSLENEISSKDDEIASLKDKLSSSNDEVKSLESKVESLEEELSSAEEKPEEVQETSNVSSNNSDNSTNNSNSNNISNSSNSSNSTYKNNSSNSSSYSTNSSSSSYSNNSSSSQIVYCNGGKYTSNKYHKSPTAHNMEGAIKMTKQDAQAAGYVPCKTCY
ncbi:hypothetical protein [Intestinibacter bartlettii]|uniref:Uncharacterized protein n=1 Tax=Intestinibacter bartlettii TaxID=261299 RepID=A0ABS6DWN9_9FIRM|nr:hypothetical protein [Intestinibacter bartlettii]MBU5336268.1 hypothetical protein [Intestinibacter bartlettii]